MIGARCAVVGWQTGVEMRADPDVACRAGALGSSLDVGRVEVSSVHVCATTTTCTVGCRGDTRRGTAHIQLLGSGGQLYDEFARIVNRRGARRDKFNRIMIDSIESPGF